VNYGKKAENSAEVAIPVVRTDRRANFTGQKEFRRAGP
jgi:hypothetical protein